MRVYVGVHQEGEISFSTIREAKEYLKNLSGDDVAEVILAPGRYFFKDTLRFNETDRSAVYKAMQAGTVYFDGGIVLDNHLVQKTSDSAVLERVIEETAREYIYEIDLSGYDIELGEYGNRGFRRPYIPAPNEFFIKGKAQRIASYPKQGYFPLSKVLDEGSIPRNGDFSKRGGILGYDNKRVDKWANAKDVYLAGFFGNTYADDTIKVERINTEDRSIKLASPHLYGIKAERELRWKGVNLLEEIGEAGEYYIDREQKKLYFYPEHPVEDDLLHLSVLTEPMLSFMGAEHITFEGIIFENARGMGVYIERG